MRRVLCLVLLAGCVEADSLGGDLEDVPDADWNDGKADGANRIAVTASSVEALNGDLSSLTPPCVTADAFHDCEFYLSPSSALGVTTAPVAVLVTIDFPAAATSTRPPESPSVISAHPLIQVDGSSVVEMRRVFIEQTTVADVGASRFAVHESNEV